MSGLVGTLAVLGKPYTLTKSRLGAITRVYSEPYICDIAALQELFRLVGEKLSQVQATKSPTFSFLISFSDQTHHDGVPSDFAGGTTIPIGKLTERIVINWSVTHDLDGSSNELSITVRISNPINPLMVLQAALSKSPGDLDNFEFETGSTCATVNGAGHAYADEIFLRMKNWIEARNRPHPFLNVHKLYKRFEWLLDEINRSLLPILAVAGMSLYVSRHYDIKLLVTWLPTLIGSFYVLRAYGSQLNSKMSSWAQNTSRVSVFQVTNGDQDAVTKMAARAQNGLMKLTLTTVGSLMVNIVAGVICWYFLERT